MYNSNFSVSSARSAHSSAVGVNAGLRDFMLSVYKHMAFALSITGVVALFIASTPPLMMAIFSTPLYWVIAIAPIFVAMYMSSRLMSMSLNAARICFWVYAVLIGMSLASIFIYYTGVSIARVFFISSSVFATMSIYGYVTKRDLSSFGSFAMMGLFGILGASLINIFLKSSAMDFMISVAGVLIFVVMTAYDTQRIKDIYFQSGSLVNDEDRAKYSIHGALALYMDFINLFVMLLRFFGDRRS